MPRKPLVSEVDWDSIDSEIVAFEKSIRARLPKGYRVWVTLSPGGALCDHCGKAVPSADGVWIDVGIDVGIGGYFHRSCAAKPQVQWDIGI